jgi:hypothetical protein
MVLEYTLRTENGKFSFELALLDPQQLRPHEEFIEESVREMVRSFERDGWQKNPIIVDRVTSTVLDGTHRHEAAVRLGLAMVLCMVVDYQFPGIKLGTWDRQFMGDWREALEIIKAGAKVGQGESLLITPRERIKFHLAGMGAERYRNLNAITQKLAERFGKPRLNPKGTLSQGYFGIRPPLITKQQVIQAARSGQIFPPKSTRHIFPVRVLLSSVPVKMLRGNERQYGLGAPSTLDAYFRSYDAITIDGRQEIEGRFYEEEELLFYI